jgi:hypothetical protein
VQKVWDAFEKMRPAVEEIYRNENGITPEKIEARPVEIGGRMRKGGYFPMIYDPNRAPVPDRQSTLEMMEDPLIRGSVFSGMTKARVEQYSAPVMLDLNALPHALRQSIHFVTHFESIKNVRNLLNDKELAGAVRNKLSPEDHQEFNNWLEAVATNGADRTSMRQFNAAFGWARGNITAAMLGFSYTTLISQIFGISTSVAVLGRDAQGKFKGRSGADWMAYGFERYLTNPGATIKQAVELSGEMRHRIGNADRDISQSLERLTGKGGFWAQTQKAALIGIGGMQFVMVDVPTWTAAFNKGLEEGRSETEAVEYADAVLRTSQASGHTKDLSSIQRQKNIWQLVTMFSTYTMLAYNLIAQTGADMTKVRNLPSAVSRLMWLIAIPAVAEAFMRAEGPDDDDEQPEQWWALRTLVYATKTVPVAGGPMGSMMEGHNPSVPPLTALAKWPPAFKAMKKLAEEDEEFSIKDARKVLEAFGMTFGLAGTVQAARALKAAEDEEASLYDYLVGVKEKK